MLYRKISKPIIEHFKSGSDKILIVEGARQIGKSYIIRHIGKKLFPNYVEINLVEDKEGPRNFENVRTTEEFYLVLGSIAGNSIHNAEDTLIFLDEIQEYPQLLTLLKFLRQEGRFTYVASGSLLGITMKHTTSIPIGSIKILEMYPLDIEEFLIANGVEENVLEYLHNCLLKKQSPLKAVNDRIMELFKRYLITGGMPDAVNEFLSTRNVVKIREIQREIHNLYADDAAKYDESNKLKIKRIYNLLPSVLAQKKKRLVFKDIENIRGVRSRNYIDEIDYLIDSGITLPTMAISNPKFPLVESVQQNLLKLYLNDVGILSGILYENNIKPILENIDSINLGAIYECVVAMELKSHGYKLFYYDNKKNGEVDFLIDDYNSLSILPIEVKSGKDYTIHSALSRFINVSDYNVKQGVVLSNSGEITEKEGIIYLPVYMTMYLGKFDPDPSEILL